MNRDFFLDVYKLVILPLKILDMLKNQIQNIVITAVSGRFEPTGVDHCLWAHIRIVALNNQFTSPHLELYARSCKRNTSTEHQIRTMRMMSLFVWFFFFANVTK